MQFSNFGGGQTRDHPPAQGFSAVVVRSFLILLISQLTVRLVEYIILPLNTFGISLSSILMVTTYNGI